MLVNFVRRIFLLKLLKIQTLAKMYMLLSKGVGEPRIVYTNSRPNFGPPVPKKLKTGENNYKHLQTPTVLQQDDPEDPIHMLTRILSSFLTNAQALNKPFTICLKAIYAHMLIGVAFFVVNFFGFWS